MKRCALLLFCFFLLHQLHAQVNGSGDSIKGKELSVRSSFPRFLRQGDHLELATRIVNTGAVELTGQVQLELVDAATGQSVDGWFLNTFPNQYFTVGAHDSETVRFPVQVPPQFSSLLGWRISAATGNEVRDRRSGLLPVLSDRIFHSEKITLDVNANKSNSFRFAPLLKSAGDESIQHQSLTVEALTHPTWYAVEALASLRNADNASALQVFDRYYACALGGSIVRSDTSVAHLLERWQQGGNSALAAFVAQEKNLLDETPWLLHAQPEPVQKKLLAMVYDSNLLARERMEALQRLKGLQKKNGSFAPFAGGADDLNTTLAILQGIAQLQKLSAITAGEKPLIRTILLAAVEYIDSIETAQSPSFSKEADLIYVPYLYVRSFFPNTPFPAAERPGTETNRRYRGVLETRWTELSPMLRAMTATAFARSGRIEIAKKILAASSAERQPVEIRCLFIEAFKEIGDDARAAALCKEVLKEKEIDGWGSPQATRAACYALLTSGLPKLPVQADVRLGTFRTSAPFELQSASGYFRSVIDPKTIVPGMGEINFTTSSAAAAYPAHVYWEYFGGKEPSLNPALRLEKKLLYENGKPIAEGTELHTGDPIIVQLRITATRNLDRLDLHDTWASVLRSNDTSGYRRIGKSDAYQSTGPLGVHFYIDHLAPGAYEISYRLRVEQGGEGNMGAATIRCIDMPEVKATSGDILVSATQ